ncbi:glycosyltransferase family 2 protein [Ruminiclostridium cellobioparum]|uniref:glycosyltransferase family 2 protein n=1 Tax=Ruminiclostridium cellobioparum TaxID=29355 RepID=UPI0028A8099A|nr:glycosyltransferase family 2 protein [Ruminiclostridium cellobioparum]
MKITACSIVKNEANNIEKSINSYRDAVDEIIIVDTGSTDNTVEICKNCGANVLFYKWNNDFSAAKNYALEHANGDWIIFLDADEWFEPSLDKYSISNILSSMHPLVDGILLTMCDFDLNDKKVRAKGVANRLFRRNKKIRYHGRIHEMLKKENEKFNLFRIEEFEIYHSGYANELSEIKSNRNIDILYDIYNTQKKSTELYFYLFRENYILGNLTEADKFYDLLSVQKDLDNVVRYKDNFLALYEYRLESMIQRPEIFNSKDIDMFLENVYKKYPDIPIFSYYIGCQRLKYEDFSESYRWICNAIKLNNYYNDIYINTFVNFLADANYKLGCIKEYQRRSEDALVHFIDAIKQATLSQLSLILLKIINIIKSEQQEEIILFINSILDINNKAVLECILLVLKKTRLHNVFIYYAIKYNKEFDGQDETTYIAMILLGQIEIAVETAIEASRNFNVINDTVETKPENINIISTDTNENDCEDWHLTYAVIAILYSKDYNLYKKYKHNFNTEQRDIIDAYINEKVIDNITIDLYSEFDKLYNTAFYILKEPELYQFKEKVIGKT